jgi:hypothetical protein
MKDLHGLGGGTGVVEVLRLCPCSRNVALESIGGCGVAVFEHCAERFGMYPCRKMCVYVVNTGLDDIGSAVGGIVTEVEKLQGARRVISLDTCMKEL